MARQDFNFLLEQGQVLVFQLIPEYHFSAVTVDLRSMDSEYI